MDKLSELSEKVDRIDRHLSELDDKITESYNLSNETDFIKVLIFIYNNNIRKFICNCNKSLII